jgi:hypothetical protein
MFKDLSKYVRFARKNGLKSLKVGEIEFEFSTPPEAKKRKAVSLNEGEPIAADLDNPTEDEMLLWSTDSYDYVREMRKKAASKERITGNGL